MASRCFRRWARGGRLTPDRSGHTHPEKGHYHGRNERANSKLVQYLIEAYAKERELERSLQAHIAMTDRKPYKKRLQEHLRETKRHAKLVERRAKKLGAGGLLTDAVKEASAWSSRSPRSARASCTRRAAPASRRSS